jgi:hypothetical protein
MDAKTLLAILLVVLGIVVLANSGVTFMNPRNLVDFLGTHMEAADNHSIPPAVGALSLLGGIGLLLVNPAPH